MLTVALTGGLATGKSTVGRMFGELGCELVEADRLGHEVLAGPGRTATVALFGAGICHPDGSINRRALGAVVFADPAKLAKLNAIVHPLVEKLREERFLAIFARDPHAIVLYEAAIHIETGLYKQFARVVLVTCDEETQIRRAMERSQWTREETLARLRRQMPLAEKRKFADYVIDTSVSLDDTRRQAEEIYNDLRALLE
ncbi:MAG: dephospho-CoA kinase [Acidobacteria bacterium]|jgi:dephospho-CoA kinase|nr:dephospho-CoA kinase [Acidobacteriota bacterium]